MIAAGNHFSLNILGHDSVDAIGAIMVIAVMIFVFMACCRKLKSSGCK